MTVGERSGVSKNSASQTLVEKVISAVPGKGAWNPSTGLALFEGAVGTAWEQTKRRVTVVTKSVLRDALLVKKVLRDVLLVEIVL